MVFEELEARLRLDSSGVSQGLDDAESDMEGFADRANNIGGRMQSAGKKMSLGITAPLVGGAAMALNTASDVEEMESKMEAVFGDATDDVQGWADETGDAFGRSRYQMQEMATGFQDTFVPLGFARDEATGMSKDMAELSSDLASFNNIADEDAARKLQSAMVGNHSAVRDFGVILTQERLGEQVQEMFGKGIDAASEQEKAMARMELIMSDTADAQGDAARTSDSFANKMRAAKGEIEVLSAQIGQHLLPFATALIGKLSGLVSVFGNLSDRQQKVIIAIGGVLAVIGPLLLVLGTLVTMAPAIFAGLSTIGSGFSLMLGPIGLVILALAALAAAFATDFMGIRTITENVVGRIREVIGAFLGWLRPIWEEHFSAIAEEVKITARAWKDALMGFVEWARPFVDAFLGFISDLWSEHGDTVMAIVEPLMTGLKRLFDVSLGVVRDTIVGFIRLARGDWEGAAEAFTNVTRRLVEGIVDLFRWLKKKLIGGSVIPSMLSDILSAVRSFDLGGAFKGALGGALRKVRGMVSKFKSAGRSLASGVSSGIKSKASSVGSSVSSMASKARSRLPFSDAEEGPLSDLMKSGEKLPETFAKGIERRSDRVASASNTVAGKAKPSAAGNAMAGGDRTDDVLRKLDQIVRAIEEELDVDVTVEGGGRHDPF